MSINAGVGASLSLTLTEIFQTGVLSKSSLTFGNKLITPEDEMLNNDVLSFNEYDKLPVASSTSDAPTLAITVDTFVESKLLSRISVSTTDIEVTLTVGESFTGSIVTPTAKVVLNCATGPTPTSTTVTVKVTLP